jgi:glycosyltransferase involved in cell wall biosynthesis
MNPGQKGFLKISQTSALPKLSFVGRIRYAEVMTTPDFSRDLKALERLVPEEPLYRNLFQLVFAEALEHVLYIGVQGDLQLLQTLIQARNLRADKPHISLIESDPPRFEQLLQELGQEPGMSLFQGYSQRQSYYPDLALLTHFFRTQKSAWHQFPLDYWLDKAQSELEDFSTRPEEQMGLLKHLAEQAHLPAPDMLILDGSEFTTEADLAVFAKSKLIILTGVSSYRNFANFQRLVADPNYYLMYQHAQQRMGFAIFKRKPEYQQGISVVIHSRNEAANIEACLASVAWAQERVVVDMFSEDDTPALAQSQGARVVPHVPIYFIDEARNFGLSQVQYAWTLVLDADERVPPALAEKLQFLSQNPEGITGFWLARQNWFFGQWIQHLFPDYQMRFFASGKGAWTGMIHDFARIQGETFYLPADPSLALQHYSYTSVQDFCERQIYYARSTVKQYMQLTPQIQIESQAIRKDFEHDLEKLLKKLKSTPMDDVNWLTQTLYLFSNYLTGASLLEAFAPKQQTGVFLSGYTYLKNGIKYDYPFRESIRSVISLCDQFVICYATDSEDETLAALQVLAAEYPQIELYPSEIWRQNRGHEGEVIRKAAEEAMGYCRGEWLWHVQADEVYHEDDLNLLREQIYSAGAERIDAYRFRVLHFYGNYTTLIKESAQEIGWYQRCIRLTRRGKAQHIKDAWTQILNPGDPGQIKDLEIRIFHYGHVRGAEAMRIKMSYMEKLYAVLPDEYEVCPEGEFIYDRIPSAYLTPFQGSHPQTLRLRMAQARLTEMQVLSESSKRSKPRVLILSRHHQIKKGFGISLNEIFGTGILQRFFEVHHLAWHYHDADTTMDGVQVYATRPDDSLGLQRLKHLLVILEPDVILLHADMHFFPAFLPILEAWQGAVVGWFPIDYARDQNPSSLMPLLQRCNRIASLSGFGVNQIQKNYTGPCEVVPLGVNTQRFLPVPSAEFKSDLRRQLRWPEAAYVFLMVGNNFWRKGIEYAIESFYQFKLKFPDLAKQAFLYLHTENAEGLKELIHVYGLSEFVKISDNFDPYQRPFSHQSLLELYQASDCLLLTSLGEGFGMPLIEAQACGLPVLAPDHSAIPEVVGRAGLLIKAPQVICGQSADSIVWLRVPDPVDAAEKMAELMTQPQLRAELSARALQQAKAQTWHITTWLLADSLGQCHALGRPVFEYEEPRMIAV